MSSTYRVPDISFITKYLATKSNFVSSYIYVHLNKKETNRPKFSQRRLASNQYSGEPAYRRYLPFYNYIKPNKEKCQASF